jgi:hypothetical protein
MALMWGRVRPDGIIIPLPLSHRMLAEIVCARRPSVTHAIGLLEQEGRLRPTSEDSMSSSEIHRRGVSKRNGLNPRTGSLSPSPSRAPEACCSTTDTVASRLSHDRLNVGSSGSAISERDLAPPMSFNRDDSAADCQPVGPRVRGPGSNHADHRGDGAGLDPSLPAP